VIESLFAILSLLVPAAVVLYLCGGWVLGVVGADYAAGGAGMLSWLVFGLLVGVGFGKRLRWLTEKHPISIYPHLPTGSW